MEQAREGLMPEQTYTVTVREADVETLNELAEREWRTAASQASALLENALHAARARANSTPDRSRTPARRSRSSSSNGSVRVEV